MPKRVEGRLGGEGLRIALVAGRTNGLVVDRLIDGATDCLLRHGVADADMTLVRVPGSFEIPQVARRLAAKKFDAVVCLGAVIRGETSHFDHIAATVLRDISGAAAETGVPMTLGVLTTDTLDQALERAGGKAGNKGWEAALAALELANLKRQLR